MIMTIGYVTAYKGKKFFVFKGECYSQLDRIMNEVTRYWPDKGLVVIPLEYDVERFWEQSLEDGTAKIK
jgi:hypothetical protein